LDALEKAGLGKWEPVPTRTQGGRPTRKLQLLQASASAKPPDSRGEAPSCADADSGVRRKTLNLESKETTKMNPNPVIDWSKQPTQFWSNSTYSVCAFHNHCGEVGLISIRRHDWKPCSDWQDKQAIKNQIVRAEWEAAELYPAESRVQDLGNWSHLWVMPNGRRYSFGFIEGKTNRSDMPAKANEAQRPLAQRGDMSPLKRDGGLGERALSARK